MRRICPPGPIPYRNSLAGQSEFRGIVRNPCHCFSSGQPRSTGHAVVKRFPHEARALHLRETSPRCDRYTLLRAPGPNHADSRALPASPLQVDRVLGQLGGVRSPGVQPIGSSSVWVDPVRLMADPARFVILRLTGPGNAAPETHG